MESMNLNNLIRSIKHELKKNILFMRIPHLTK